MTHDRLATRKWKVPSDISESRSMMRLPSLSKSKSEVFGQSGHCSARLLSALRANCGLMQCNNRQSITSSASNCIEFGTVRPRAFAVLKLITNSNLVSRCTGRSAGFSPLTIRPV
jgi:hypothetical protein